MQKLFELSSNALAHGFRLWIILINFSYATCDFPGPLRIYNCLELSFDSGEKMTFQPYHGFYPLSSQKAPLVIAQSFYREDYVIRGPADLKLYDFDDLDELERKLNPFAFILKINKFNLKKDFEKEYLDKRTQWGFDSADSLPALRSAFNFLSTQAQSTLSSYSVRDLKIITPKLVKRWKDTLENLDLNGLENQSIQEFTNEHSHLFRHYFYDELITEDLLLHLGQNLERAIRVDILGKIPKAYPCVCPKVTPSFLITVASQQERDDRQSHENSVKRYLSALQAALYHVSYAISLLNSSYPNNENLQEHALEDHLLTQGTQCQRRAPASQEELYKKSTLMIIEIFTTKRKILEGLCIGTRCSCMEENFIPMLMGHILSDINHIQNHNHWNCSFKKMLLSIYENYNHFNPRQMLSIK